MRFVSKYPKPCFGVVIPEKFVLALDGQRDKVRDSVAVFFDQLDLTPADIAYAKTIWPEKSFTGRWLDADGVTLQPIDERISSYDTEAAQKKNGWTDEVREQVEQFLLRSESNGVDFALVSETNPDKAGMPWRNYDITHHFRVASIAADLDIVEDTLAWERAHRNRPSVVKALEEKLGTVSVPVEAVEDDGPLVAA